MSKCTSCAGLGCHPPGTFDEHQEASLPCGKCNGSGEIWDSVPMPNSNNKPQHQPNPLPSLADSSQPAISAPTGTEPLASESAEAGGFLLLSYDPADLIGRRFLFRRLEARLQAVAELPSATWIHADGTVQYVELPEVCDGPDLLEVGHE